MLHDALMSGRARHERRHSARITLKAEVVVRWHHDPKTPVRYQVLDMGEGGMRILSAAPLLRGLSGTAVKLLPKGQAINRVCTVAWLRPPALDGPFEVGLRFA